MDISSVLGSLSSRSLAVVSQLFFLILLLVFVLRRKFFSGGLVEVLGLFQRRQLRFVGIAYSGYLHLLLIVMLRMGV